MAVTLENTFKPFLHLLQDIPRTFAPYRQNSEKFSIGNLIKDQNYRDQNVLGDLAQPARGLVNIGKGVWRIARGAVKLLLPVFIGLCVYKMLTSPKYIDHSNADYDNDTYSQPSFWLAFKGEGKKLLYDFTNGLGILLRGALQLATTPLTWLFRIPIRLARTAWENRSSVLQKETFETDNEDDTMLGTEAFKTDEEDDYTPPDNSFTSTDSSTVTYTPNSPVSQTSHTTKQEKLEPVYVHIPQKNS